MAERIAPAWRQPTTAKARRKPRRRKWAAAVKLQVREAFQNLTTAQQRVEVSRQAQSESEESLRIIQNRYAVGLATITDLLQVETAHTRRREELLECVVGLSPQLRGVGIGHRRACAGLTGRHALAG